MAITKSKWLQFLTIDIYREDNIVVISVNYLAYLAENMLK